MGLCNRKVTGSNPVRGASWHLNTNDHDSADIIVLVGVALAGLIYKERRKDRLKN